ncbi:MAG: restriction endonuclease subunit S, partial [Candidatus Paceibacterota bacterium]
EFNVVIDTAEGLTELRSLILGLAIRGKLVPQDPSNEAASELLKKIKTEQAHLYEEGKIRKPKDLDPLLESDYPFEIPSSWVWERMGNISDVIRGITFPGSEKKEEKGSGDILCLKTSNVQDQLEWDDVIYVDESFVKREDQYLQKNDIVISMANSYELVGKVALADQIPEESSFGGFLSVIRPFLFDPLYYFYLLRSNHVQEAFRESSSQTVNIANISLKVMLPIPMPLPPLAEQNRIVQRIESLFAEVDELETKLNRQTKLDEKLQMAVNTEVQQAPDAEASKSAWSFITSNLKTLYHTPEAIDNLKKNILNEAVRGRLVPQKTNDEPASELLKKIENEKQRLYDEGEIRKPKDLPPVKEDEIPFEIPDSWEWVRLGQISLTKGGKRVPKGFSLTTEPTDYVYLRVSDMQNGTIIDSDLHYIDEKTHEQIQKYKINKDDIYMTIVGATIGKCGLVPERFSGSNLTENAVKITPIIISKEFLYQLLDMPLSQEQFIDKTKQVGVQKMAIFRLKNTLLTLPPLEEQHRIVRRIEELFAICDRFKAQLQQRQAVNERLVKGLVGEVLEGGIRL